MANAAAEVLDSETLNHLRTCRTLSGQGAAGVVQLRRKVEETPDAPWVRRIPLTDAVMSDSISCLRFLVDEVQVDTLNARIDGYTPLQKAVIWGRLNVMVYLLSRGADLLLEGGSSVVDMARLRQQRLQEALDQAGDGAEFEGFSITKTRIEPLLEEGRGMLQVLEGIESYGSYQAWAEHNGDHPLVKRYSHDIRSSEPRYQLCVLRALVLLGRASLLSRAERSALAAAEAAEAAAQAKEEQSLLDALVEAGFSADTAKEIRDAFRIPTLKALRAAKLSAEDIEARLEPTVRQRRMKEGERRRFVRYVRELEDSVAAPPAAAAAPTKATAKSTAKSKAKGPPPAAKAALLAAMGAKGAGRSTAAKESASKDQQAKKGAAMDSIALVFHEALPDNGFTLIIRFMFGV